tara:strand:+ start:1164 stop:2138 length:975 start_codon:yes stop_codon:yes gene_type:complete
MAVLASRQDLIDYSLRRLGFPVIEINVDDDQVSDRVDDAIQFWQEYHFDGTERAYIKHKLTGSKITLQASLANNFTVGETVTGSTSGTRGIVVSTDGTEITVDNVQPGGSTFSLAEVITGDQSGYATTTSSSTAYTKGDLENGYIPIGDNILGVTRMFKFGNVSGGKSDGLFDVDYQFALNDMYNLLSADLTYYSMVKTHLSTLESIFVTERQIRFNRKTNRLYIDTDFDKTFDVGDYIIAEGQAMVAGTDYSEVYNDMFLKKYTTALIKRQWGENMKKFGGIQLPGGVTLNGDQIFQEAVTEIQQTEEEMQSKYELPPAFMVG